MLKIFLFFLSLFPFFVFSQENKTQIPSINSPDKIYEKLGHKIDLNLTFTNQNGQNQSIQSLLQNNSILVLTLNYYRCTTMCTFQFLNLAQVIKETKIPFENGYSIASISFDPTDTIQKAKEIHDIWVPKTGNLNTPWNFYVGTPQNIEPLTKQLNFFYEKDDEGNYSHAAALFFIQPDGTLYRYLYGIVYDKHDFVHALTDTSNGHVGSIFDKFYGIFMHYNAQRGKYFSILDNQ